MLSLHLHDVANAISDTNPDAGRKYLEPGTRIGDHLVVRSVLGEGGTAVVYEALHTRLDATVAVKLVDVHAAFVEDAAARLRREAHVCARLEDRHVPKVYDVGEMPDGTPYVVMEKVSGPTLESMLEHGPVGSETALSIVIDLLEGLSAVHQAGVVHRDIKPSNLIVQLGHEGSLHVRLMDFGVSRSTSSDVADPAITREGSIVGTPHYMAPEQITGEGVDARADLYATGVLLFEMLANRLPFDGGSVAEVMAAVLRHQHPPLSTLWPEVPPALEAAIARAMAERPQDRFASAHDMREALLAAISLPAVQLPVLAIPSDLEVPRKRRSTLGLSVASLALALTVVAWPRQVGHERVVRDAAPAQQVSAAAQQVSAPAQQVSAPAPLLLAPPIELPRPFEIEATAPTLIAPLVLITPPSSTEQPAPSELSAPADPAVTPDSATERDPAAAAEATPRADGDTSARTRARSERVRRPRSEPAPSAPGIYMPDYIRQLEAIEESAAKPAPAPAPAPARANNPGPLPANPYQD